MQGNFFCGSNKIRVLIKNTPISGFVIYKIFYIHLNQEIVFIDALLFQENRKEEMKEKKLQKNATNWKIYSISFCHF